MRTLKGNKRARVHAPIFDVCVRAAASEYVGACEAESFEVAEHGLINADVGHGDAMG